MRKCPKSTYYSDPEACFTVESLHETGAGIWGYYTNEFDAAMVAAYLKEQGHRLVSVKPYNPKANARYGVHPLIEVFHLMHR